MRCMVAGRASRHPLAGLPAAATDGSILLSRPERQFTNSDAFFAFSAIRVRFGQVAALRTIVLIAWPRNRVVHLIAHAALQCNRTACVRVGPANSPSRARRRDPRRKLQ